MVSCKSSGDNSGIIAQLFPEVIINQGQMAQPICRFFKLSSNQFKFRAKDLKIMGIFFQWISNYCNSTPLPRFIPNIVYSNLYSQYCGNLSMEHRCMIIYDIKIIYWGWGRQVSAKSGAVCGHWIIYDPFSITHEGRLLVNNMCDRFYGKRQITWNWYCEDQILRATKS